MKVLQHDLKKIDLQRQQDDDGDDDNDDDDLDDREGLVAELEELKQANAQRQDKLEEYEKNKKWNVDNMFHVKEERTIVNPGAGQLTYTDTGFVKPKETLRTNDEMAAAAAAQAETKQPSTTSTTTASSDTTKAESEKAASSSTTKDASSSKPAAPSSSLSTTTTTKSTSPPKAAAGPSPPPPTTKSSSTAAPPRAPVELGAMETYHEFTEKYAHVVEEFMALPDLARSKAFLLQNADIILQENSSNYLLLASLEDEMNGYRDKMKRTARQAQIVSNIAELAKTMHTHPGNVIQPFFARLEQRQYLEEFLHGVQVFVDKIIKRAVTKKAEMDAQRGVAQDESSRDLADVPREDRLGPGGLDPLEVIETLPQSMVDAFESRDVEQLKQALMQLDPEDAQRHMDRCIASGLWVANA